MPGTGSGPIPEGLRRKPILKVEVIEDRDFEGRDSLASVWVPIKFKRGEQFVLTGENPNTYEIEFPEDHPSGVEWASVPSHWFKVVRA